MHACSQLKPNYQRQTFFESCNMHFSRADWRLELEAINPSFGLEASVEYCMHFRKCLIRSLMTPTIVAEAFSFAFSTKCVTTLTILICMSGCLTMFLWSKCLTKMDSNKWEFSPGIKICIKEKLKEQQTKQITNINLSLRRGTRSPWITWFL